MQVPVHAAGISQEHAAQKPFQSGLHEGSHPRHPANVHNRHPANVYMACQYRRSVPCNLSQSDFPEGSQFRHLANVNRACRGGSLRATHHMLREAGPTMLRDWQVGVAAVIYITKGVLVPKEFQVAVSVGCPISRRCVCTLFTCKRMHTFHCYFPHGNTCVSSVYEAVLVCLRSCRPHLAYDPLLFSTWEHPC